MWLSKSLLWLLSSLVMIKLIQITICLNTSRVVSKMCLKNVAFCKNGTKNLRFWEISEIINEVLNEKVKMKIPAWCLTQQNHHLICKILTNDKQSKLINVSRKIAQNVDCHLSASACWSFGLLVMFIVEPLKTSENCSQLTILEKSNEWMLLSSSCKRKLCYLRKLIAFNFTLISCVCCLTICFLTIITEVIQYHVMFFALSRSSCWIICKFNLHHLKNEIGLRRTFCIFLDGMSKMCTKIIQESIVMNVQLNAGWNDDRLKKHMSRIMNFAT